jgi:hypothetical protein
LDVLAERRCEEPPELPENDRRGEREPGGQADLERGGERLGDSKRDRLAVLGRQPAFNQSISLA